MKLKSYQSNSVEAAIRLAKVELGEDAIFMGSRENGPGDESGARFEVTFAVAVDEPKPANRPADAGAVNGANQNGSAGLGRPAWAGPTRRALEVSKKTPSEGPLARPDNSPPTAPQPAAPRPVAALRHWKEFLPKEMATSRRGQQPGDGPPARPGPPAESQGQTRTITISPVAVAQPATDKAAVEVTPEADPKTAGGEIVTVRAKLPPGERFFAVIERLSSEAGRLRELLAEKEREPAGVRSVEPRQSETPARSRGIEVLVSQGMCAAAARSLIDEALKNDPQTVTSKSLQQKLEVSISRGCRVDATLGRPESSSEPAIAVLVGPTGVGKTSTICKLALRFGVEAGRPLHLVSLDQFRLGAPELLGSFADLLNAPFTAVEECGEAVAAVRRAAAGAARPPLILIDTPGYGPAEWKQARTLARALAGLPGVDTHMVVAATSSEGHLRRSLEAYRIFHPRKLLITKLDECAEAGAIVGETLRCRLPISYFSTGQRIPEDIAAASAERLAHQLLQAF